MAGRGHPKPGWYRHGWHEVNANASSHTRSTHTQIPESAMRNKTMIFPMLLAALPFSASAKERCEHSATVR